MLGSIGEAMPVVLRPARVKSGGQVDRLRRSINKPRERSRLLRRLQQDILVHPIYGIVENEHSENLVNSVALDASFGYATSSPSGHCWRSRCLSHSAVAL
ncbi:hypothetical protein EAG_07457 [Camponotus floridanus]|uniref:Uncharacterized protein n=1 Tax=Camponotus floridanus TaxID=104421 RepID=E2ACK1_CAMFO|nr:hypothetical protein EAG_07457 [Camponotus floridanus]